MRNYLIGLACVAVLGCSTGATKNVVAKLDGESIQIKELDAFLKNELRELRDEETRMRRQGLEQLINERLVTKAAKKESLTNEAYLKKYIEDTVPKPDAATIDSFFKQHQAELPKGAKIEDYREQITSFLSRDAYVAKAREMYQSLRSKAKIEVLLQDPPRERVKLEAVGPSEGPEAAAVTMVIFSDFECPFCGRAVGLVKKLRAAYPDRLRVVFRQFPLESHKHAEDAAMASLCANEQKMFWDYHDLMFSNQGDLSREKLVGHATGLGMDTEKFSTCLTSGKYREQVQKDRKAGMDIGISGTPAFVINGMLMQGMEPYESFVKLIDSELPK